jgi:hypothetical protein
LTGWGLPDKNEIDADVQCKFHKGFLEGRWLRFRYANLHKEEGRTVQQFRAPINLPISLL